MNRIEWLRIRDGRQNSVKPKQTPPKSRIRSRVPLGPFSNLRKLMRLLRQARVPVERMNIIEQAEKIAKGRA